MKRRVRKTEKEKLWKKKGEKNKTNKNKIKIQNKIMLSRTL